MWRASRRSHNALRNPSRHRREPARIEIARPGVLGWPDEQPYDQILVSAEAGVVPGELLAQLGTRGAMVLCCPWPANCCGYARRWALAWWSNSSGSAASYPCAESAHPAGGDREQRISVRPPRPCVQPDDCQAAGSAWGLWVGRGRSVNWFARSFTCAGTVSGCLGCLHPLAAVQHRRQRDPADRRDLADVCPVTSPRSTTVSYTHLTL